MTKEKRDPSPQSSHHPSQFEPKRIGKMAVHHPHATMPFKIAAIVLLAVFMGGLWWFLQNYA